MGSAPSPPDPAKTAAAQAQMNQETAITQQQLNMVNQVTPYGSLTYSQTGQNFTPSSNGQTYYYNAATGQYQANAPIASSSPVYKTVQAGLTNKEGATTSTRQVQSGTRGVLQDGWSAVKGNMTPSYTATTTLTPEQQAILGQTQGAQLNLATLANDQSGWLKDYLGNKLDLSGAPPLAADPNTEYSADRQRVEDALMQRMQPSLTQTQDTLRNTLINQGIRPGTAAWDSEWNRNSQSENDARLAAILAAGQEQGRLVSQQNAGRSQYLQEQYAARNQPLNEIAALLSGSQVTQPNFVSTPTTGVEGVDYTGLVNQQYQAQLANSQSQMGGIFGLLSSGISLLSDRRAKQDIERVGSLDNGLPVYAYRYKGSETVQIGLMADEVERVHPEAVAMGADGFKRVRYDLAVEPV